jgi:hypothetical protein
MSYKHTQSGTWSRILATIMIVIGALIHYYPPEEMPVWVPYLLISVGVMISAVFSSLQTAVDSDFLHISYSVGLIRRKIPLGSIKSVKQVRNRWWYGLGIRLTPHGWLWNIQGMDAIELTYENGKCFRVGTDDPEGLQSALTTAAELEPSSSE